MQQTAKEAERNAKMAAAAAAKVAESVASRAEMEESTRRQAATKASAVKLQDLGGRPPDDPKAAAAA